MVFDFERMIVYRKSLDALDIAVKLSKGIPRGHRQFADQLNRAASSVCLNVSEGVGEFKKLEKVRFYRMAYRSNSESCSVVQILYRLGFIRKSEYDLAYSAFADTARMLNRLIQSLSNDKKTKGDGRAFSILGLGSWVQFCGSSDF